MKKKQKVNKKNVRTSVRKRKGRGQMVPKPKTTIEIGVPTIMKYRVIIHPTNRRRNGNHMRSFLLVDNKGLGVDKIKAKIVEKVSKIKW